MEELGEEARDDAVGGFVAEAGLDGELKWLRGRVWAKGGRDVCAAAFAALASCTGLGRGGELGDGGLLGRDGHAVEEGEGGEVGQDFGAVA